MNITLIPAINQHFTRLNGKTLPPQLQEEELLSSGKTTLEVNDFIGYLVESGRNKGLFYLRSEPTLPELNELLRHTKSPVLLCQVTAGTTIPVVVQRIGSKYQVYRFTSVVPEKQVIDSVADLLSNCCLIPDLAENRTYVLTSLLHQPAAPPQFKDKKKPTNMGRLFQLLTIEKKQIGYIYIYAAVAGIISLSLPLGIQSIIGFVSGGILSTSIVVLIIFITVGMLLVGALQLMQVWLVEHLQQRIFSRLAFDFSHRVPRLQLESLQNVQPVELMNRFFETLTLQKGVAKILLEFNAALLQIIFGLLLLSLYHPWFIFFGIFLAATLALVIKVTSTKGVDTSLLESKYKYQLVSWLDSMARSLYTFKLSGYTNLSMQKTDYLTSNYILARRQHFSVLMTQYVSFVIFKAVITAGLLILGCVLVLRQQINIGQFVAAEIVIILIMNSVEKIILKLDMVYDVLTGLKKITAVTELPLEESQGLKLPDALAGPGLAVQAGNLSYKAPSETQISLHNISFSINASEKVCLTGLSDAGKFTLADILLGLAPSYQGRLAFNNLSFRDLDLMSLRNQMAAVIANEQIFEGTLLQNITCGAPGITTADVQQAIEVTGLSEYIQQLPNSLHTELTGTEWQLPRSVVSKIMMARCFVRKPKFVILDNNLLAIDFIDKMKMFQALHRQLNCTLIIISHDRRVMEFCDRVLVMQRGTIIQQGTFAEVKAHLPVHNLIENNA